MKSKTNWETGVNTAAIMLTAWGTTQIMNSSPLIGALAITGGMLLEYTKYSLRERFEL